MNTKNPWIYILMVFIFVSFLGTIYYFVQEAGNDLSVAPSLKLPESQSATQSGAVPAPGTPSAKKINNTPPISDPGPVSPPSGMENAIDEGTITSDIRPDAPKPDVPNSDNNKSETDSFKFAVIGDTQRFDKDKADGPFQKAIKNISAFSPEIVLAVGDLVGSCDSKDKCEKNLTDWKGVAGSLFTKIYPAMGNHDRTGHEDSDAAWQNIFDLPKNGPAGYEELVYSFDRQDSHFVILNSEKPASNLIDKIQRDWLEKDLSDNNKDNTFVIFHEPAYPVSSKIGESLDAEKEDRDALWDILKKQKVEAVFNGHEHIVSRKKIDGIYQFVSGNTDSFDHDLPKAGKADWSYKGNSYLAVEVADKKITVKTFGVDGGILNTFEFENGKN